MLQNSQSSIMESATATEEAGSRTRKFEMVIVIVRMMKVMILKLVMLMMIIVMVRMMLAMLQHVD